MSDPDSPDDPGPAVLLDARGERCPLPVIRLGRLARELRPGALVRLLATDPAATSDVPAFCRMRGHTLVSADPWADEDPPDASVTAYLVRVSATAPAAAR